MKAKYALGYFFLIALSFGVMYVTAIAIHSPQISKSLVLSVSENQHASIISQLQNSLHSQPFNGIAFVIFVLAIIHTFFARKITLLSERIQAKMQAKGYPESISVEILRFFGEVEVIFGLWVIPLLAAMAWFYDWKTALNYLNQLDYTEPIFIVVIMAIASTKPIVDLAQTAMNKVAKLGGGSVAAWWWSILTLGPLTGSLITEPAAMTISALLLSRCFFEFQPKNSFRYATLGLLFTNISIGGTLTNFAAPPVLMVSKVWNWDTTYMLKHFGVKAFFGILIANFIYYLFFRKEFSRLKVCKVSEGMENSDNSPFWLSFIHCIFLAWIVIHSHFPVMFVGSFLLFLGFYSATLPYQDKLDLKMPVLVGFFLAGLVIHGSLQGWWISPLLSGASFEGLMILSTVLTAFNDNAGITFLATLIPSFTESLKYAIVAGAVTGGGLTVIANAPNLPGQAILGKHFPGGVSALYLFLGAIMPAIIVGLIFYIF